MVDNEPNADRDLSEVARQTDHSHQVEEEKKDRRLENSDAFLILLTVAMLPAYVMSSPLTLVSKDCLSTWLGTFLIIIVVSCIFNYVTLRILNRVASVKQMDSY